MDNPFGGSAKAMFEDFEKATKAPSSQPNEKDMQDFEKNFMGMF
ncbi:MAG: hypothetical protein ACK521_08895 [bacterium]|jgi:hypothetical protein